MFTTRVAGVIGCVRRCGSAVLLITLLACAAANAAPAKPSSIDEWRAQVTRIRQLADNDAPAAYREARELQANLPPEATLADKARVLNLLSRIEAYLALTEPAAAHAREAFDLAMRNGDRVGEAEADLNIALNSINQGRLDEMVAATQNSVMVLEGVNRPDLLGEALLRTTAMYRRFEQFDESVAVAVRAMEIARRTSNPLVLAYAHQGLAIAYDQSYRFPEAREQYTQMRGQARAARSLLTEAAAVSGLAGVRSESGDRQSAEELTREALSMYRRVGAPFAASYALFSLADMLARKSQYHESLDCLNEALDIYQRYPNRISQWFALNARSTTYQAMGELDKAAADAQQAYEIAKALGAAIYLSGSASRLASIAATRGNYQRAYELALEASQMTVKAARDKAGQRVVQLVNRYESENKQHEIEELTRRSERQAAQLLSRELQQRWLWTVLTGVVLALAGVGLFVFRLRQSQHELELRVQARTQELRQQARYLRALIDTLPMLAWLKDTHSRYLIVNHALAEARNHTVAEVEGQSDLQLLPPALAQQLVADDREVMKSRQRKTTEECLPNGNGGVWIETYKAAVLDEDGTVLGTVGVSRNISERKAAEAAREVALSEARRLAHQRSQFLAQMSHELRTPLNAMMGFAQILQRDKTLNERAAKAVRVIEESGQHLLRLINDILDLARIDAGKLELVTGETHLAAFLQIVCDSIQVKADDKGLKFVVEPAPDLPETVHVDEKRLRQVLLNLLSNAVKFSDAGQVTFRITRAEPGGGANAGADATAGAGANAGADATPDAGEAMGAGATVGRDTAPNPGVDPAQRHTTLVLCFEVEDEGIGMSERELARAFQPFEQLADSKRREGGAGLGLAISRQLVHLMGGEIRVRSWLGAGSVFAFEIETATTATEAPAATPRGTPIGYHGERRKILVADDVADARALLVTVLSELDFHVREATNGWEALQVVQAAPPDLVLVDLAMPILDGWETIRALRRTPEGAAVPIIATSASAAAEVEASSRAAGANTFIAKPVQESTLLQAIGTLLKLDWIREAPAAPPPP
jgi:PAS domain S-box-containing protein